MTESRQCYICNNHLSPFCEALTRGRGVAIAMLELQRIPFAEWCLNAKVELNVGATTYTVCKRAREEFKDMIVGNHKIHYLHQTTTTSSNLIFCLLRDIFLHIPLYKIPFDDRVKAVLYL